MSIQVGESSCIVATMRVMPGGLGSPFDAGGTAAGAAGDGAWAGAASPGDDIVSRHAAKPTIAMIDTSASNQPGTRRGSRIGSRREGGSSSCSPIRPRSSTSTRRSSRSRNPSGRVGTTVAPQNVHMDPCDDGSRCAQRRYAPQTGQSMTKPSRVRRFSRSDRVITIDTTSCSAQAVASLALGRSIRGRGKAPTNSAIVRLLARTRLRVP